jgi:hypothetical protein
MGPLDANNTTNPLRPPNHPKLRLVPNKIRDESIPVDGEGHEYSVSTHNLLIFEFLCELNTRHPAPIPQFFLNDQVNIKKISSPKLDLANGCVDFILFA